MTRPTDGPFADAEPESTPESTPALRARLEQLRTNLAAVEQRIAVACASAGRPREEVTLIVVTKTCPVQDTRLLASLGVREVAENRDQDAAPKAAKCLDLPLTWHFVGQVQTNKARSIVQYANRVHSVDRIRLVTALSAAVQGSGRPELGCLVQVALGPDGAGRAGADPQDVRALCDAIAGAPGLRLDGLMAVAPLATGSAQQVEVSMRAFTRLVEISTAVRAGHPAATMVSAGMSGDLEQAVAAGATHVRVGTAVLGVRPPLG